MTSISYLLALVNLPVASKALCICLSLSLLVFNTGNFSNKILLAVLALNFPYLATRLSGRFVSLAVSPIL